MMATSMAARSERCKHVEKKKYCGTTQKGVNECLSTFVVQILLYFLHDRSADFPDPQIFRICWITLYAGLVARWFVIFHDCGHNSFTDSSTINRMLHHVSSIFCLTPNFWSKEHLKQHHVLHSHVDDPLFWQNYTVTHTKEWFANQSIFKQVLYALLRNPFVTFLFGPLFLWIVRYPLLSLKNREYALGYVASISTSASLFYVLWSINGTQCLIDCALGTYFATVLGLVFFHVQHSFKTTYPQQRTKEPPIPNDAALSGSCLIQIPWFCKWFFMGIEYHHIHHLNMKVPGYLLQDCHNDAPAAYWDGVTRIGCFAYLRALNAALYDQEKKVFVGIPYFAILARLAFSSVAITSLVLLFGASAAVPSHLFRPLLEILSVSIILTIFLSSWMIRYLGKKYLLSQTPLAPHLVGISMEQRKDCIVDLHAMFPHKDLLCSAWRASDEGDLDDRMVILLTGVTGYVGKAILHQLLTAMKEAASNRASKHPKVLLLVRSRRKVSIEDRVDAIRKQPIFSDLQDQWERAIEVVEMGDMTLLNCGISADSMQKLNAANVTHLIHCAGDVTFDRPMGRLAAANITFSLQLQAFAKTWPTFQRMVYVATAFVNPESGSKAAPLRETLVDLKGIDPVEVYRSMVNDDSFAIAMKGRLGFKNNYAFSKCIAEHLLARDEKMELWIARPSVVGPSWVLPFSGWNGDQPSTITALGLLIRVGCLRFIGAFDYPAPLVPVDIAAAGIIYGMVAPMKSVSSRTSNLRISHLTWSISSKKKFSSFNDLIEQGIRYWVVRGDLSVTEGVFILAVEDFVSDKSSTTKNFLRKLINRAPIDLILLVERGCSIFGLSIFGSKKRMTSRILRSSKIAELYYPHLDLPFYFDGSMHVPASLDPIQYAYGTSIAMETFLSQGNGVSYDESNHLVELIPSRRSDLWWALTLPSGSWTIRMMGFLLSKLLRATCGSIVMDIESLSAFAKEAEAAQWNIFLVLLPTHRSVYDFFLLSYLAFAMPGLGIDLPCVAVNLEFTRSAFFFLLRRAHAIWVDGCGGEGDAALCDKLDDVKFTAQSESVSPMPLVFFLEGARSRDRRPLQPKSGFLKMLQAGIDVTEDKNQNDNMARLLLPVAIDYERVVEEAIFLRELQCEPTSSLSFGALTLRVWEILTRQKVRSIGCLGSIHITFGRAFHLQKDSSSKDALTFVQNEQASLIAVTDFHIDAAHKHLRIPKETLISAIRQLGGRVLKSKQTSPRPGSRPISASVVKSPIITWTFHMQWAFRFAPLLLKKYPKWATWLLPSVLDQKGNESPQVDILSQSCDVETIVETLGRIFHAADELASRAKLSLSENRMTSPSQEHLAREMQKLNERDVQMLCPPIVTAAAGFAFEGLKRPEDQASQSSNSRLKTA